MLQKHPFCAGRSHSSCPRILSQVYTSLCSRKAHCTDESTHECPVIVTPGQGIMRQNSTAHVPSAFSWRLWLFSHPVSLLSSPLWHPGRHSREDKVYFHQAWALLRENLQAGHRIWVFFCPTPLSVHEPQSKTGKGLLSIPYQWILFKLWTLLVSKQAWIKAVLLNREKNLKKPIWDSVLISWRYTAMSGLAVNPVIKLLCPQSPRWRQMEIQTDLELDIRNERCVRMPSPSHGMPLLLLKGWRINALQGDTETVLSLTGSMHSKNHHPIWFDRMSWRYHGGEADSKVRMFFLSSEGVWLVAGYLG